MICFTATQALAQTKQANAKRAARDEVADLEGLVNQAIASAVYGGSYYVEVSTNSTQDVIERVATSLRNLGYLVYTTYPPNTTPSITVDWYSN